MDYRKLYQEYRNSKIKWSISDLIELNSEELESRMKKVALKIFKKFE